MSTVSVRLEKVETQPDWPGDREAGAYERLVLTWDGLTCYAFPKSRRVYWANSWAEAADAAKAGVLVREDFLPAPETGRPDFEDAERFTVQRIRFYIPPQEVA